MQVFRKNSVSTTALLVLAGIVLVGCAVTRPDPAPRLADIKMIDRALLVTEGIEIEVLDADGSTPERIRPDEVFSPGRRLPALPWIRDMEPDAKYSAGGYPYFHEAGAYYGIAQAWQITVSSPLARHLPFGYMWGMETRLLVRQVIPGSPAARAGLGEGDGTYIWDYELRGETADDDGLIDSFYAIGVAIDRPSGERVSFVACRSPQGDCQPVRRVIDAEERARPYRVRVHVSGRKRALYGLLAFFPVYSTAEGSAGRLYRIDIPDRYIERAAGGNVSVVYQPYEARYREPESGDIATTEGVSWALWMSDVPFYE